jgi:hypothetical protein
MPIEPVIPAKSGFYANADSERSISSTGELISVFGTSSTSLSITSE